MRKPLLTILLLIPLFFSIVEAKITFEPIKFSFNGTEILDYLNITYKYIGDKTYRFTIKPYDKKALLEKYSLSDLKNLMEYKELAKKVKISNVNLDRKNLVLTLDASFPRIPKGIKQRFRLGTKSITINAYYYIITVKENIDDSGETLYESDKAGTMTLKSTSVSGSATITSLDYAFKPADNISIPIDLTVSSLTTAGFCNVTGVASNRTTITENVSLPSDGTYTTANYWREINNLTCEGTYSLDIVQNQWGCFWKLAPQGYIGYYATDVIKDINAYYVSDCSIQIECQTWVSFPPPPRCTVSTTVKLTEVTYYYSTTTVCAPLFDIGGSHAKGAYLELGKLTNATTKEVDSGVNIISLNDDTYAYYRMILGHTRDSVGLKIYGGKFSSWYTYQEIAKVSDGSSGNAHIYRAVFDDVYFDNTRHDFYDVTVYNTRGYGEYFVKTPAGGSYENIEVYNTTYGIYVVPVGAAMVLKNVKMRNCDYITDARQIGTKTHYCRNCDSDNWSNDWDSGDGEIVRDYEFDLLVTDKDNSPINSATVDITSTADEWGDDTSGNDICSDISTTINSTGQISTQNIPMGFYNATGGDTMYDCNPYRFEIVKSGYETLNFTTNITEKTKWNIALLDSIATNYTLTVQQSANATSYNDTHINWTLSVYLFNSLDSNLTDINVTIDSDFGTSYLLDLNTNTSNTTTFTTLFTRGSYSIGDQAITVDSANATMNGLLYTSNPLKLINPVDPETKPKIGGPPILQILEEERIIALEPLVEEVNWKIYLILFINSIIGYIFVWYFRREWLEKHIWIKRIWIVVILILLVITVYVFYWLYYVYNVDLEMIVW